MRCMLQSAQREGGCDFGDNCRLSREERGSSAIGIQQPGVSSCPSVSVTLVLESLNSLP